MNKYEKAYKQLYRMIVNDYSMGARIINDFDSLKELVERATPKKVVKRNRNYCPKCDGIITINTDRCFCNNLHNSEPCGQALDWSEDK